MESGESGEGEGLRDKQDPYFVRGPGIRAG